MKDNTVISGDGIEIYTDKMFYYADEYIDTLRDKDSIYNTVGHTFTGMIKYINRHMRFNKDVICADINILNDIWEIYTELVYKYNQKPTIEEYALLIGVNRDTVYAWMKGEYRSTDICEKLGTSRPDTIKKWQEECKLGRYKSAASGNVGGIFLCKAVDGMVETAPIPVQNQAQQRTPEQIQQERAQRLPEVDVKSIPSADF